MIKIVHGNLLLAEINMIGLDDKIANETTLVVTAPVGRIACPFMGFSNDLSAVKTFLVVFFCAQLVGLGKLHPGVDAVVELGEAVWLYFCESALVAVAIMLMHGNVACSLVLRFMVMPGKDKVASATGMTTAIGLIGSQILWFAGSDLCRTEHLPTEIIVASAADIDMGLFLVGTAKNAIVTAVESATVCSVLMLLFFLIEGDGCVFLSS